MSADAEPTTPPRVLLVDENDDNRDMIALSLEARGYAVERVASAAEGLERLRRGGYRLVLGHYGLPDKNAAVMFKEAKQEGLLEDTATLVMSGQPDPLGVESHQLIPKPLDLDRLLRQVQTVVGPAPPRARLAADANTAPPVELALYLSLPWPSSLKARRNLEKVLSDFRPSQVRLTIHDLAKDPGRAEADGIVFSPTLVKQSPEPRAWVMGDLSDRRVLANLLLMCGLEPRKTRR
ncbi:MAG TPA: circadian clock KaiB family protein [Vicinamibacteria bacterium]|nr:circadian clock KaiB family protein [Vicinamibacteria bacterium]